MRIADVITALILGFFIGILIGANITNSMRDTKAVLSGHAEYYINIKTFDKEWRWKEIK